jgi:hypothetical protein
LAGSVEGRHETLAHDHFLDVVHEDVEVVQVTNEVVVVVDVFLDLGDPVVQTVGVLQLLEVGAVQGEILVELDVEELQEVGLFVREGAVDLDVVGVGLLQDLLDHRGLAGRLLAIEKEGDIGPDQPHEHFPPRHHLRTNIMCSNQFAALKSPLLDEAVHIKDQMGRRPTIFFVKLRSSSTISALLLFGPSFSSLLAVLTRLCSLCM